MRNLTDHKVNPANDTISVTVMDEPGSGGASHSYWVKHSNFETVKIEFQNGPINENGNGVNGITNEVLLAIVADRLFSFQTGPYSCKANAVAVSHIEEAQNWLAGRTLERMQRGVEGTHKI